MVPEKGTRSFRENGFLALRCRLSAEEWPCARADKTMCLVHIIRHPFNRMLAAHVRHLSPSLHTPSSILTFPVQVIRTLPASSFKNVCNLL